MADDGNGSNNPIPRLGQPRIWFDPWNYPSRIPDSLAIKIAEEVAEGAALRDAAMMHGISWGRVCRWLRLGAEASARDADGNDRHADYLNFFLKIQQAVGMAGVAAQQQAYQEAPAWWLTHNPEHKGNWGTPIPQISNPLEEEAPADPSDQPVVLPKPSVSSLRNILKTLISAGGAVSNDDVEQSEDVTPNRQLDVG